MSEVTSKLSKAQIDADAQFEAMLSKYNVVDAGTGKPFWMTQLSEKVSRVAIVRVSPNTSKVYFRVAKPSGGEINIDLGMHYNALQSLVDYDGQEIDIVVAPRIPNPAITDADIEAVKNLKNPDGTIRGEAAVANIKAARAADTVQGHITLVSYTEFEE